MTPKPRRLPDALSLSETGATLLQRVHLSQRAAAAIESECLRILPGLHVGRSVSCELRGTVLRLTARHPAQLAKLRQAVPRLVRLLQQQGLDVSEIKISVQPRGFSSSAGTRAADGPAGAGKRAADFAARPSQLAAALGFSKKLALTLPDSAVRRAAQRLSERLSSRLAQTRESDEVAVPPRPDPPTT